MGLTQEIIDLAVSGHQFNLALFATLGLAVFHTHHAAVPLIVNVFKYILVVYLTGGWLLSARIVAYLDIGYFFPTALHTRYQIAFVALQVKDIVQYFARRAIHALADEISLGRML